MESTDIVPLSDNLTLYSGDSIRSDIAVFCTSSEMSSPSCRPFMQWFNPSGRIWLSFFKINDGYLLRFNELADFFISFDGKKVIYKPSPEVPSETIWHLFLDQVVPLIINLRGGEALHASSVLTERGAIAFIGATGLGKSTLAGTFMQAGSPLLTDDYLSLLEQKKEIYAVPAYPSLRLWEDSLAWLFGNNGDKKPVAHYTEKLRVDIERNTAEYCTEPQLLKRLYVIVDLSKCERNTDISVNNLSPRDSLIALVRCSFRLDVTDRGMLARQFHFLERVASRVSVRRLIYPREFNHLPAVREAILNDLKDLDN